MLLPEAAKCLVLLQLFFSSWEVLCSLQSVLLPSEGPLVFCLLTPLQIKHPATVAEHLGLDLSCAMGLSSVGVQGLTLLWCPEI